MLCTFPRKCFSSSSFPRILLFSTFLHFLLFIVHSTPYSRLPILRCTINKGSEVIESYIFDPRLNYIFSRKALTSFLPENGIPFWCLALVIVVPPLCPLCQAWTPNIQANPEAWLESLKELLFDLTVSLLSAETLPASSDGSWRTQLRKGFHYQRPQWYVFIIRVRRGWKHKQVESWWGQTSTDSLSTLSTPWACQVSCRKCCCFSLKQFMCSAVKLRQTPSSFLCLIWGLDLCDPEAWMAGHNPFTAESPICLAGSTRSHSPLQTPADSWALLISCVDHYFPLACPFPCPIPEWECRCGTPDLWLAGIWSFCRAFLAWQKTNTTQQNNIQAQGSIW